jgi:DNA-binding XRE family transcriptional regulator
MTMANQAKKGADAPKEILGPEDVDWTKAKVVGRGVKAGRHRFTLKLLREAIGVTQASVAEATGMHQPDISKLENKDSLDDVQVSTLRRYAKALGADVEVAIVLNGRRYSLTASKG